MGTNYYAIKRKLSLHNYPIHIGKSSAGWKFLFRGYLINEDDQDDFVNIKSIKDWKEFLDNKELVILDEYDNLVSYEEFFDMIEKKQLEENKDNFKYAVNVDGYRFLFKDFS
jgi:hypothetical protein